MIVRPRVLLPTLAIAGAAVAVIVSVALRGGGAPRWRDCAQRWHAHLRAVNPRFPWNYDGAAGTYRTSGTPAGLPSFGAIGTDLPRATSVLVVGSGNNTAAANRGTLQVNNTVVYFEPGEHVIQNGMFTGHDSAYVGGYTAATLRSKVRRAQRLGVRWAKVDEPAERQKLLQLATGRERVHPVEYYRNPNADHAPLLNHGLWLAAYPAGDRPLLLSVTPVDGEWALLRYFFTLTSKQRPVPDDSGAGRTPRPPKSPVPHR